MSPRCAHVCAAPEFRHFFCWPCDTLESLLFRLQAAIRDYVRLYACILHYIYIYIALSLSLYIYIYIYIYLEDVRRCASLPAPSPGRRSAERPTATFLSCVLVTGTACLAEVFRRQTNSDFPKLSGFLYPRLWQNPPGK